MTGAQARHDFFLKSFVSRLSSVGPKARSKFYFLSSITMVSRCGVLVHIGSDKGGQWELA